MPANDKQVGGNHYKSPIQHWDFVYANDIPYMEAQIIKYVMRHQKKGGKADLEKAMHFIEKLIELKYDSALLMPEKGGTISAGGITSPTEGEQHNGRDSTRHEGQEGQGTEAEGNQDSEEWRKWRGGLVR